MHIGIIGNLLFSVLSIFSGTQQNFLVLWSANGVNDSPSCLNDSKIQKKKNSIHESRCYITERDLDFCSAIVYKKYLEFL